MILHLCGVHSSSVVFALSLCPPHLSILKLWLDRRLKVFNNAGRKVADGSDQIRASGLLLVCWLQTAAARLQLFHEGNTEMHHDVTLW